MVCNELYDFDSITLIISSLTTMADAQSLALNDRQFMELAKPTTTLSGRLRFNKIVAAAAYVQSLLATATGSYKTAACIGH